jgi:hypothetical protein
MQSETGSYGFVPYEIHDLTLLKQDGIIPGFYFSVGTADGEPVEHTVDGAIETIELEGPYATREEVITAVEQFILDATTNVSPEKIWKGPRNLNPPVSSK